jgi:hypothetical protein
MQNAYRIARSLPSFFRARGRHGYCAFQARFFWDLILRKGRMRATQSLAVCPPQGARLRRAQRDAGLRTADFHIYCTVCTSHQAMSVLFGKVFGAVPSEHENSDQAGKGCEAEVCGLTRNQGKEATDARTQAWQDWTDLAERVEFLNLGDAKAASAGGQPGAQPETVTAASVVSFGRTTVHDVVVQCSLCAPNWDSVEREIAQLENVLVGVEAEARQSASERKESAALARALCILWVSRLHAHVTTFHAHVKSRKSEEWAEAWKNAEKKFGENLDFLARKYVKGGKVLGGEALLDWLIKQK